MLQMNHYLTFKSSNDDLKVGRVCYLPKDQQNLGGARSGQATPGRCVPGFARGPLDLETPLPARTPRRSASPDAG